jgi:hypothetical protein
MSTFVSTLVRDVTCAVAAAVITLIVGASFVDSTALPPGVHAHASTMASAQPPAWFGQPQPAVLVD